MVCTNTGICIIVRGRFKGASSSLKDKDSCSSSMVVSAPDPPCTRKKKRKESAEEGLVQLIQNNLQSQEFQRVESDWLIGN